MYPRLRPLQRGQTKPFGHRCAVRCSPHRTSSPKRERNSLTVMMDFRFNRLGFFISDILSPFVRLLKLDIHLAKIPPDRTKYDAGFGLPPFEDGGSGYHFAILSHHQPATLKVATHPLVS